MNDGYIGMWDGWSKRRSGRPVYDDWLDKYKDILDKYKDSEILDLGAGLGANSLYLVERDYKVVAADFSREALNNILENVSDIKVDCFDMRKTFPYKDKTFKIVIADLCLHYFDDATTKFIIKEIKRVLDKDGVLLCRVARTDDFNFGALEGEEVEKNFFFEGDYTKRFFDDEDVKRYFSYIGEIEFSKTAMVRDEEEYSKEKMLYEIKAVKKED